MTLPADIIFHVSCLLSSCRDVLSLGLVCHRYHDIILAHIKDKSNTKAQQLLHLFSEPHYELRRYWCRNENSDFPMWFLEGLQNPRMIIRFTTCRRLPNGATQGPSVERAVYLWSADTETQLNLHNLNNNLNDDNTEFSEDEIDEEFVEFHERAEMQTYMNRSPFYCDLDPNTKEEENGIDDTNNYKSSAYHFIAVFPNFPASLWEDVHQAGLPLVITNPSTRLFLRKWFKREGWESRTAFFHLGIKEGDDIMYDRPFGEYKQLIYKSAHYEAGLLHGYVEEFYSAEDWLRLPRVNLVGHPPNLRMIAFEKGKYHGESRMLDGWGNTFLTQTYNMGRPIELNQYKPVSGSLADGLYLAKREHRMGSFTTTEEWDPEGIMIQHVFAETRTLTGEPSESAIVHPIVTYGPDKYIITAREWRQESGIQSLIFDHQAEWTTFYESGSLREKSAIKEGRKLGDSTYWHPDGYLISERFSAY